MGKINHIAETERHVGTVITASLKVVTNEK
jgi:hypothetical protein